MTRRASGSSDRLLAWACFAAMLLALFGAFIYAAREAVMGDIQRIFYVHLPLAWVGFVAFGHAAWAGAQYLRTGRREWDVASASAAEIGVLFATLVILSAMAMAFFYLIEVLERIAIPWHASQRAYRH